jgi:hypothetical protein
MSLAIISAVEPGSPIHEPTAHLVPEFAQIGSRLDAVLERLVGMDGGEQRVWMLSRNAADNGRTRPL